MAETPLDRLRCFCLAFPEVTERMSHGEPTWFIRGKRSFAMFADHHHHDDRLAVWCAAPPGAKEALIAIDPERFFNPPYVGTRGWVGVILDPAPDWDEVLDIVNEAHATIAAKLTTRKVTSR
ncbi:MmcQ/YjbR family DNA-binding protein [soil metagenome]